MNRSSCAFHCALLAVLATLTSCLYACAAHAESVAAYTTHYSDENDPALVSPVPPLVGVSMDSFWNFVETQLNNRRRMIQFAVVGMSIALYFMFRARG